MSSKLTYNRLLPIINSMDKSIVCQSLTDNLDGTYTFACNYTKWLTEGYELTIGLNTYTIVDFECNEWIKVSGTVLPTQSTFDLYPFNFKHGTITKVASELNNQLSFKDRTPLLFLHEIAESKLHLDEVDSIDIDEDVRLYFLIGCNIEDWTQLDGDTKGVQPMRNACNEFIKALSVSPFVPELTGVGTVRNYNIFGNYDDKGVIKNIFNEFLSGVQLRISISFLKDCDCCLDGNLDSRPAPAYVYDSLGNILAILYSNEIYISTGGTCLPVTIKNINTGDIITTVASGGEYEVEQLTEIVDTIFANTTTIIDPII